MLSVAASLVLLPPCLGLLLPVPSPVTFHSITRALAAARNVLAKHPQTQASSTYNKTQCPLCLQVRVELPAGIHTIRFPVGVRGLDLSGLVAGPGGRMVLAGAGAGATTIVTDWHHNTLQVKSVICLFWSVETGLMVPRRAGVWSG